MVKRNVYLSDKPWEEALAEYLNFLSERGTLKPGLPEKIPVEDALGRVTAKPVYARFSSPHYHAAAMDGMAVNSADTYGAMETAPKRFKAVEHILRTGDNGDTRQEKSFPGSGKQSKLQNDSLPLAIPVDTGDPIPENCDAVIMIEDVHFISEDIFEIIAAATPWQHVRLMGEDVVATEMIVPANHHMRPVDIGAVMASGVHEILVHPKPRVGLIPTGNELVRPGKRLEPGDIMEFNTRLLGAYVKEWGGLPTAYDIVPDDLDQLNWALEKALGENDIVLILAGSSAGREDYTAELIRRRGKVLTHGVATKPGKPVILGFVEGKPVIGVPGYPVSAILVLQLFLQPVIYHRLALPVSEPEKVQAVASRKIVSSLGSEEFVRVKLGKVGEKMIATPMARGAGLIVSLVRADGIVRIPRLSEGVEAGEKIQVELLRPLREIEDTTVVIGSHDNTLDVLSNFLSTMFPGAALSSAHVGSMGGLAALRRGEAHLAGTHLLDEETGEYNVSFIKRILPGEPVVLINLVYREQGFIVGRGNPKNIKGFEDLTRSDVSFVNRQRGAGTRLLLDYKLRKSGIDPDKINGYEREEYTHMAVAAAVAGGSADAGLGIRAAAEALGLDFVKALEERYDLCIPRKYYHTSYIQRVLQVIKSSEFQKEVSSLGGYDLRDCGKVMWESKS